MATILGLALKINADASGVPRQLTTVEKALQSLDVEAAKVTKVFETFARASGAAADVQQRFESEIKALTDALKAGDINGQQFAEGFAAIKREAADTSAAFSEGARIIEKYRTDSDRLAEATTRLDRLLELGAITQREYNAELLDASGINAQIAKAERDRADISARAARVVEANLTAAQRAQNTYNAELQEYQTLLRTGAISQDDFNKAVDRSAQSFAKATIEAGKTGTAIDSAGKGSTLQFNELSGILSALPGPLGNVAGRFSGLASAGEGLSRVFSGGLSAGISGIGSSVAALVNPFTLAVGSVGAFGAAALAVTRGLTALDDRVENLGNIADKLGVSFEFIQTLEEAANRSGTSIDAVSAAFGRLQKSVLGVDEESKAAQKALSEIGVTAEELAQLSPEDQYQRIGTALAGIEDPARRTATATALFGKAGADLIPFFNNLPGATADIERFGRSLTALDRRRIDEFGAGLDALRLATQGLGQTLLLPFAGLGEGVATAFAEITAGITAIIDPIGQILEPVLTQIGRVIQLIGTGLGNLGRIIGAVFEPFATVVQTVSQALEPLYEGLFGFLAGFSDASVQVTEFLVSFTPIGAIAANAAALGDTLSRVVTIVTTAFSRIGEVIGNTLGQAVEWVSRGVSAFVEFTGLGPTLEAIGSTISSVFGAVSSVFQTIASAIGGTVGRLLTIAENFLGIERSAEAASTGVDQVTNSTAQLTEEQKRAAGEVQKAVENSSGVLDTAIQKAGEFGQAGFDAAFQFQEALADLKEQADANELNAEQYSRGVALATAEFDKQVDRLKQIQDETRKAAEEAQKRVDADRQIVDSLLEQARVNEQFGGDTSRARAADAVLAAEREIARIKESVATARDSGDTQAVAAGEERIRQLQEIQNQQAAIADGSARAAADEAKRVEDQKKRVDELIGASDTRSELEQQLIDVQEQQKLTLDQLIIARQTFNREQADAAAGRLAQLDQLQAKLEDQQQAVEQGFGEGFAQAFQETDRGIDALIVKAQEFGNVGALAAEALEAGIAQAQAQARDGILTQETYEREVAQQRDIFQQRLDAANRVEEFLRNGVDARQQAELKATEELEKRKKEAATNVQAIEAKLIEERKKLEEAREKGDLRGARAGAARVRELERVQQQEKQLAEGRLRQQDQIGQQFLTGLNSAQQFQSLVTQSNDNFLKSFNNTFAGANQALAANAAAAAEQAAKLERLLTPTNQLANTADIRTTEGQQLLLDVAATGVDPALVEARLQTKQLNLIAQGISAAASNYFNTPVAIVGGARLGGF
jgi:phage-related protein